MGTPEYSTSFGDLTNSLGAFHEGDGSRRREVSVVLRLKNNLSITSMRTAQWAEDGASLWCSGG